MDINEAIVREAQSWKGTPYVLKGRKKGIGADCFTFPSEVLIACGLAERVPLPCYQTDWFLHAKDEEYLKLLLKHDTLKLEGAGWIATMQSHPGNLAVTKVRGSRRFNHSAIVIDWPTCIHAVLEGGVCEFNVHTHSMWTHREVRVYAADPFRGMPFVPEPSTAL